MSGVLLLNGNAGAAFISETLNIGAWSGGIAGLTNRIGEIMIVGRVVMADELAALHAYSQAKWGTA